MTPSHRHTANQIALERLCQADPVVLDVAPAIDVLPGYEKNIILTSGAPLEWSQYHGGQREAILGAAQFEGLARDRAEAEQALAAGDIRVRGCHDYAAVGSLAGVYTASMPVFVVHNEQAGNTAYCNFYEGAEPRRLNYGCYDIGVHDRLKHVNDVLAPLVGEAIRRRGGIRLRDLMARALRMGDELHSRNTAASLLFQRDLTPSLIEMAEIDKAGCLDLVEHVGRNDYFFLRLSMAAAKATADSLKGLASSSVVSAMAFSCREFAIRVAGLDDEWFRGPEPVHEARLFPGHTDAEVTWMGGESPITETVGLGGFAQACAFPLQGYQGGSAAVMVERNRRMYDITVGENTNFKIPYFDYRGTPTGVDIFKVLDTGILPIMDVGIAGRDGGQIGAGIIRAPRECFEKAAAAYERRYGAQPSH